MCVPIFVFSRYILISLLIHSFDPLVVQECVVKFLYICKFSIFPLLLISSLTDGQRWYFLWLQSYLLTLVLWSILWSLLENVLCALRMCILLLLDGMFYTCLLGPFGVKCGSCPVLLCSCFVFMIYSLLKVGREKSYYYQLYCCLFLPLDLSVFA